MNYLYVMQEVGNRTLNAGAKELFLKGKAFVW